MPSAGLSQLTYRKLHITDHLAFEKHLLALDPECRRTRFGMATTDAFLKQYADRCFTLNAVLHGAFVGDELIGVAELRPIGELFAVQGLERNKSFANAFRVDDFNRVREQCGRRQEEQSGGGETASPARNMRRRPIEAMWLSSIGTFHCREPIFGPHRRTLGIFLV